MLEESQDERMPRLVGDGRGGPWRFGLSRGKARHQSRQQRTRDRPDYVDALWQCRQRRPRALLTISGLRPVAGGWPRDLQRFAEACELVARDAVTPSERRQGLRP